MQRVSSWPIAIDDVDALLNDIRPQRVAVIGDFCLDVYLVLDPAAAEISVETGLPTRPVAEQRYSLGGAGNVAANLAALGCAEVYAFGVIGEDPFGAEMARILRRTGIDTGGVLTQGEAWDTCAYTKVLEAGKAGQRESNRIDYGTFNRLRPDTADRLAARLAGALADGHVDAVIINQQMRHGLHSDCLRSRLRDLIRRHSDTPWVTDSRDFADDFAGTVRKLNESRGSGRGRRRARLRRPAPVRSGGRARAVSAVGDAGVRDPWGAWLPGVRRRRSDRAAGAEDADRRRPGRRGRRVPGRPYRRSGGRP